MKISYFHYLYGRGTPLNHVGQFSQAVRDLGHDISVNAMNLAPQGATTSTGDSARAWMKQRLSRYLHEPKELLWNARYLRRELAIVRRERPDVMLVRNNQLTAAEVAVSRIAGVPLVLEVNAPASEARSYYDEYLHLPLVSFAAERVALKGADQVVVVSSPLRDHFIATHSIPADKIHVNPNGADCQRFHPDIDAGPVRSRHQLGEALVVGFVGSFHPWHGLDLLRAMIEALACDKVRFLLVGQGPEWEAFGRSLDRSGARQHVALVGAVPHEEVPNYVAAMDVALVPNLAFYMSPLKLLEYMAAGRAVVAPRQPAVEELAIDGSEAAMFPPTSTGAAIASVRALLADHETRRRIGAAARRKVLASLTWRHNAQRALAVCSNRDKYN